MRIRFLDGVIFFFQESKYKILSYVWTTIFIIIFTTDHNSSTSLHLQPYLNNLSQSSANSPTSISAHSHGGVFPETAFSGRTSLPDTLESWLYVGSPHSLHGSVLAMAPGRLFPPSALHHYFILVSIYGLVFRG